MTSLHLALICAVALVTFGDQFYLHRPQRSWLEVSGYGAGYGLAVCALTTSLLGGAIVAVLFIVGRTLATWYLRRRGPDLWSGLAVLAAPYVAVWLAWAVMRPALRPLATYLLGAAWSRLTLTAAPDIPAAGRTLILATAYAFCWGSATFLTRSVLGMYAPQMGALQMHASAATEVAAAADPALGGLARAGRWIGNLERLLTLTLALTGNYTAIGFVVAAKSIARFDLARRHGEYFVVGTLCSVGIALGVGMLTSAALRA